MNKLMQTEYTHNLYLLDDVRRASVIEPIGIRMIQQNQQQTNPDERWNEGGGHVDDDMRCVV